MGFFDFLKQPDINRGVKDFASAPDAVLLDVRTPAEHRSGHIPHSVNLPLQRLSDIASVAKSKSVPLYVYCQSGGRSRQAAGALEQMGYTNVKNIGGISAYAGQLVT